MTSDTNLDSPTPTHSQTELTQLFAQTFDIPEAKLTPDATLENLGLDSLAVIEFLFQAEDKFGIKIPDQAAPPRTFGEMWWSSYFGHINRMLNCRFMLESIG